ncbi:hypothetical protein SAMN04488029_0205 [Reichenbachiella faecimaris]|uniref:HEAT repeat-containing protein n=1 Tax=Reichenbachiella faecimaris TaxID=692418 RepID=A0A1W2G5B7_REIFA|nr:hypothetical protein [Reichenbachiella faecimaris]SMD31867.1 hypothetical protein SAMN04488029_0205 [Reichenbachiella faecimaris]
MDFLAQLEKAHSKENAQYIAQHISDDANLFAELMSLFFHKDYSISQRAAHAVSHCVDVFPELITPYIGKMVNNLNNNPKVAIKRNTVRVLQKQIIPEEHQGLLVEKCFEYLLSSKETIAVKAFSMTVLSNMAKIYPELKNELFIVVEDVIKNGSAGLISRGKKVLAELKK